jgi:hypothetical protein
MLVILNLRRGTKLSGWLYATEYYVSVLIGIKYIQVSY